MASASLESGIRTGNFPVTGNPLCRSGWDEIRAHGPTCLFALCGQATLSLCSMACRIYDREAGSPTSLAPPCTRKGGGGPASSGFFFAHFYSLADSGRDKQKAREATGGPQ